MLACIIFIHIICIMHAEPMNNEEYLTGWNLFNSIFSSKQPTVLLLKYQRKSRYFRFSRYVGRHNKDEGLFSTLQEAAKKLLMKSKTKNIDITECDLVYYDDYDEISIMDDNDLICLLEKEGDEKGVRIIKIKCEQETESSHTLYRKNRKAFSHMTAPLNKQRTIHNTNKLSEELNLAGIAAFDIDARGVAILDADEDEFLHKTKALATAYEWSSRMKALINIVPVSAKSFSGDIYVKFDAAKWKIIGSYARFAGFRTFEGKYSLYVGTAKFEYTIPRSEREGNVLDYLGITSDGSIKGKYLDKISVLMESKALERFAMDVSEPDFYEYKMEL
eukprot:292030_1